MTYSLHYTRNICSPYLYCPYVLSNFYGSDVGIEEILLLFFLQIQECGILGFSLRFSNIGEGWPKSLHSLLLFQERKDCCLLYNSYKATVYLRPLGREICFYLVLGIFTESSYCSCHKKMLPCFSLMILEHVSQ